MIEYEVRGDVALVTINRPEKANAINREMWLDLRRRLEEGEASPARIVVLTGRGKYFSAGEDINDLAEIRDLSDAFDLFLGHVKPVFDKILTLSKPVVAAVNGPSYGLGTELALASDIIVMARGSYLTLSQGWIGVGPPIALALAPKFPSRQVLMEMIMFGRRLGAEEAVRLGVANIATDDLQKTVSELGGRLITPTNIVRETKRIVYENLLQNGYERVFREIALHSISSETRVGLKRFLERRR